MAGYTRQSSSNLVDGNTLYADYLNSEYNQLEAAFDSTTGHAHDGTGGNGPKLTNAAFADDAISGNRINGGTIDSVTLDNTNTVTLQDVNFTLQDDGDNTKQAIFQLSGISTSTTRTLTIPDLSGTVALTDTAQTISADHTFTGSTTFVQLRIVSGDDGQSNLFFGDGNNQFQGSIKYDNNDDSLRFGTNTNEAARITSDGKFGIGTVSPDLPLHVVSGIDSLARFESTDALARIDIRDNATTNIAMGVEVEGDVLKLINQDEKVRVSDNGNVGIGSTAPTATLQVENSEADFSNGATIRMRSFLPGLHFADKSASGESFLISLDTDALIFSADSDGDPSTTTERARINSNGALLVGTSSELISTTDFGINFNGSPLVGKIEASVDLDGLQEAHVFYGNAGRARIQGDGDLLNTNGNFGTLSDPRLKQDVSPAASQWDDVKELGSRFVNYRLKEAVEKQGADAPTLLSVLANDDFAARFPGLTKTGDDGYRSFKQSVAAMKGLIALSEAQQRIENLEYKIEKLEKNINA